MKRVLSALVVALLLWAQPAAAAFALVSHVSVIGTGSSAGINTTGASLLVAICSHDLTSNGAPTDSKTNTWTALTLRTASFSGQAQSWYVVNPVVGSGHTFACSNGPVSGSAYAAFSGADTVTPFDAETGANSQASVAHAGALTPANANSLVVVMTGGGTFVTQSVDGGFTITDAVDLVGGTTYSFGIAYLVQTSAASANPGWTDSGTDVGIELAAFKSSGGAAPSGPAPCLLRLLGVGCH